MTVAQVLYVEDDIKLARLISDFLTRSGFAVTHVINGRDAINEVMYDNYDLVILDIGLPDKDGFNICQSMRPHHPGPILMMTARTSHLDQINGFDVGADDYLVKPVPPGVLLARIKARLKGNVELTNVGKILEFGQLRIDKHQRLVSLSGESLELTSAEYSILTQLASTPGQPVSREELFAEAVGRRYDGLNRTVDGRISRLRKKLGDDIERPTKIKTIWGKGYMFIAEAWG